MNIEGMKSMNGFKRFCLIVFSLLGLLVVGLGLVWWLGPWTAQISALFALDWFVFLIEAFIVIGLVGFVCLFVAGVRAKKPKDIEVINEDGDHVSIARSAVASQATYLAEADGLCLVTKVVVDTRRRDQVDVALWIQPYHSLDVQAEAQALQESLRRGLTILVGDRLGSLTLRFLEPRQTADITPGNVVTPQKNGSFKPTAAHKADRALRHDTGHAAEKPEPYGIEASKDAPSSTGVSPEEATSPESEGSASSSSEVTIVHPQAIKPASSKEVH